MEKLQSDYYYCDFLFQDASFVNVLTREIYECDVAVIGELIVGFDYDDHRRRARRVINAKNKFLSPGLIDGHIHVDSSLVTMDQFSRMALMHGTTSIITDFHEVAYTLGFRGVQQFLRSAEHLPLKFFYFVPYQVPGGAKVQTSAWDLGEKEVETALSWPQTVGTGEVFSDEGDSVRKRGIEEALKSGKQIISYLPKFYADNDKLQQFVRMGVTCDIPETLDEAVERARLGIALLIREGLVSNLPDVIQIVTKLKNDSRRFMIISDDKTIPDMVDNGYLDAALRKAVSFGVDPVEALQMVTINPAQFFGLKKIGSIQPGQIADLILFKDLTNFEVELVMCNGEIVVENGRLLVEIPSCSFPDDFHKSIRASKVTEQSLAFPNDSLSSSQKVLNFDARTYLTTLVTAQNVDGHLPAPERGYLALFIVERYNYTGRISKSIVSGIGLTKGAFASSYAHDHHNIFCVATNIRDACVSMNSVIDSQGGISYAIDGKVVEFLRLPIGGIISDEKAETVYSHLKSMDQRLRENGCRMSMAPLVVSYFLVPHLVPQYGVTDYGIVSSKDQSVIQSYA